MLIKLQETGLLDHCVRKVADYAHRAVVTTFLLFHIHKVVQVRYLGEENMFFMYV